MREEAVVISLDDVNLQGDLAIVEGIKGIVLFAHGSGSGRKSPRNRFVASVLQRSGLSTLLFDLLTEEEEAVDLVTAELRFDIELLARRLSATTGWTFENPATAGMSIGYFGASTGAAAALIAAAERPDEVRAVVSRGGRPDLAERVLDQVRAPTLLIVGGLDVEVLALNERALAAIPAEKELAVVPGATHLFEEPGALEEVSRLATDWFVDHLR